MSKQFQVSTLTGQRARTAALLVTGMHRSGTSALARVLSILGAELPKTIMRPSFDNPKGFWESEPIAALNDALLAELGVSWDEILSLVARRDDLAARPDLVERVCTVLRSEFSLSKPLVLKEPRVGLLLKLWMTALEHENCAPRVIIPIRNPLEVCASLGARNGFSVGRSLLLWLTYVLEAERASRGAPRVVFRYEDFLLDWRAIMRRLETGLDVRLGAWTPDAELEVDAFLSASDRHHVVPPDLLQARADVVDWVKRTHALMEKVAGGDDNVAPELDAVRAEFQASLVVFAPLLAEQRRSIEAARKELGLAQTQTHEVVARAHEERRAAETLKLEIEGERDALRVDLAITREAHEGLKQERQELSDVLLTRQNELSAARQSADLLQARLAGVDGELRASQERLSLTSAQLRDLGASATALENQLRTELRQRAELEVELRAQLRRREEESALTAARLRDLSASAAEAENKLRAELQSRDETIGRISAQIKELTALSGQREEDYRAEIGRGEAARAEIRKLREACEEHLLLIRRLQKSLRTAEETAPYLGRWASHPSAKKRVARLTRHVAVRPLLRVHWLARAGALLASGLYVPQDGPGGRAIVAYARGKGAMVHPLFDDAWYGRDGLQKDRCAAIDYLLYGDERGADPNALFDTKWYRQRYRDQLVDWRLTALEHFILRGAQAGNAPHPLFDTAFYVRQARPVWERKVNPLAHYLCEGWRENLDPHPLFNTGWYYEKYPDVREAGVPALLHYVQAGAAEGRDPHPQFSTSYYLKSNADVEEAGINPLAHYLMQGWRDGRRPSPSFDPRTYQLENPEVAARDVEPLTHFLTYGGSIRPATAGDETQESSPSPSPALAPRAIEGGAFDAFAAASAPLEDNYCWSVYERLTAAVQSDERARIESFQPKAARLLDFSNEDLSAVARRLQFPTSTAPKVSIIIPVYNQLRYTLECLASLSSSQIDSSVEIVLLDDASQDETSQIAGSIEGVRYIRNDQNLGYLRSVNRAAKLARGDVLVILNNDTQVDRSWLQPLLDALGDPTIGIVAPKMLFPNGRLQEAGAKLKADGAAVMIGLFEDPDQPRYCYDRDVDYVSGACVALRRADFEALDGFDESFAPAYCEDSDLCMRVRRTGKRVRYVASSKIYHHLSVSSDALPNAYKMRQVRKNQQKMIERWSQELEALNRVRVISFYLPQFHAIPENDRWWGAGFTEWRNVTRALPNFVGHYQPHRPSELGYYDLSQPEIMERQAELARAHGVGGFCYYYYWFAGRRVLEAPLERLVQTGKPDFPFCICWANENWTRTWESQHKDILLEQHHSDEDDRAIIADMIRFLRQENYIRINGKPLLVVYRPQLLPNSKRTTEIWRQACREAGIGEIYLAMVEVFENALKYPKPAVYGFDATIEFPPSGMSAAMDVGAKLNPRFTGVVSDYNEIVLRYLREPIPGHTRFRGAMPSWDATARRQDASYIFHNPTPGAFQAWLETLVAQTRLQNFGDERIIFVNAWNEWAEGAHLEPDLRFGRGWLEAVRNAQLADMQLTRHGR